MAGTADALEFDAEASKPSPVSCVGLLTDVACSVLFRDESAHPPNVVNASTVTV